MRPVKKDSTDQSVVIRIIDDTAGTPENAVVWNTAGIDLWYRREGAVKVSITEATLAALDAAHSDGGFLFIGDGYYRLDLPDAAVATGADGVMVGGTVTGMIVIGCYVPLVDLDHYTALASQTIGTCTTNTDMRGTNSAALASVCTEGRLAELDAANIPTDIAAIPTTPMRGTDNAALASVCTEGRLAELDAANLPTDISAIPTTAMRGTDNAALASVCTEGRLTELDAANLPTDIAAIPTTPMRGTDGANTTVPDAAGTVPTAAEIKTAIEAAGSHLAVIKAATDLLNFTAGNVHAHTKATDVGGDASAANQAVIMGYLDTEIAAILAAVDTEVAAIKDAIEHATYGLSAIRTRGDAAWITGGGGALTEILNIQPLVPNSIDLADTATVRIGLGLTNMLDDLPGTAEITQGTIKIERKAFGGTSWSTVVDDAACSEVAGLVYYDEVFDSGTGYAQGDSIRITFKNQKITAAANDYEITGSDGWPFQTYIRDPLLSLTGVTSGGTWTMAEWLKMQIALAGGKFRDKSGVSGTYEILDPDDGTTVIAEAIPSETSPYWQITKMI